LTIRLNGEARELAGPVSISALLAALDIDPRRVAVEHNLVVVRREAYDSTRVADGDDVEIVNFVGGGAFAAEMRQEPAREIW
jgi:thiamine biosynthesis protein ThiS